FLSSSLPDIGYTPPNPVQAPSSQEGPIQERKTRIMQKIDDAIATFDDNGEYLDYSWKDIVFS
ncbi:hypothetical protein BDB01DRAFT_704195, partial [Pilobolus umbonatus]